ncbi:MAG: hypothetical protein M1482_06950 [Chloroflexi bacterium]|nr:hypothetical protein [Chloroflexota bacterium]
MPNDFIRGGGKRGKRDEEMPKHTNNNRRMTRTKVSSSPTASIVPAAIAIQPPAPTLVPTRTATPRPTEAPTPLSPDYTSIQQLSRGTNVILAGYLSIPGGTYCQLGTCGLFLTDPSERSRQLTIFVDTPLAGHTPAPNEMFELADQYKESDLRVRTEDSNIVGSGALIRVRGRICNTTKGAVCISQINRIEQIKQ